MLTVIIVIALTTINCGVVGSTPAFLTIGFGFETQHRLFSNHRASALCTLRSLDWRSTHWTIQFVAYLLYFTQLAILRGRRIE